MGSPPAGTTPTAIIGPESREGDFGKPSARIMRQLDAILAEQQTTNEELRKLNATLEPFARRYAPIVKIPVIGRKRGNQTEGT